jgi:hypothetical protein
MLIAATVIHKSIPPIQFVFCAERFMMIFLREPSRASLLKYSSPTLWDHPKFDRQLTTGYCLTA